MFRGKREAPWNISIAVNIHQTKSLGIIGISLYIMNAILKHFVQDENSLIHDDIWKFYLKHCLTLADVNYPV